MFLSLFAVCCVVLMASASAGTARARSPVQAAAARQAATLRQMARQRATVQPTRQPTRVLAQQQLRPRRLSGQQPGQRAGQQQPVAQFVQAPQQQPVAQVVQAPQQRPVAQFVQAPPELAQQPPAPPTPSPPQQQQVVSLSEFAQKRVANWNTFLQNFDKSIRDVEKVLAVNNYVNNNIEYQDDRAQFGIPDYWATPNQLFSAGVGDCEDYTIAKFYSLLSLGVPESDMALLYCRIGSEAHMVLMYSGGGYERDPLILDNYNPQLLSYQTRFSSDLHDAKFLFNRVMLQVFNNGNWEQSPTPARTRIRAWNDVLTRIEQAQ